MNSHTIYDKLIPERKHMTNSDWYTVIHRKIHRADRSVKHINDSKISLEKEPLNPQNASENTKENQYHNKNNPPPKVHPSDMIKSINTPDSLKTYPITMI